MQAIFPKVKEKNTPLCVGIDPHPNKLPAFTSLEQFCQEVLLLVAPLVGVVKFQSAIFEAQGPDGLKILKNAIEQAKKLNLAVILDYKRADIPDSAIYYAQAAFDVYQVDAVTITPWMGLESIKTFVTYARKQQKGVFVVISPTSGNLWQDHCHELMTYLGVLSAENMQDGLGDVGVVMGSEGKFLNFWQREFFYLPFLIPGIGHQGGNTEVIKTPGTLISASRSILFPKDHWQGRIQEACQQHIERLKT